CDSCCRTWPGGPTSPACSCPSMTGCSCCAVAEHARRTAPAPARSRVRGPVRVKRGGSASERLGERVAQRGRLIRADLDDESSASLNGQPQHHAAALLRHLERSVARAGLLRCHGSIPSRRKANTTDYPPSARNSPVATSSAHVTAAGQRAA